MMSLRLITAQLSAHILHLECRLAHEAVPVEMEDFQVRKLVVSLLIYIFSVPAGAILQSVYMMDQILSFQQGSSHPHGYRKCYSIFFEVANHVITLCTQL
jgi:hypothetical protein